MVTGYARLEWGPPAPPPVLAGAATSAFARPRPPGPPCAAGNYPLGLAWSPCGLLAATGAADGWVRCFKPPPDTPPPPREGEARGGGAPSAAAAPRPAAAFFPGEALYDLAFHPVGLGSGGAGGFGHPLLAVCARGHPVTLHAPSAAEAGAGGGGGGGGEGEGGGWGSTSASSASSSSASSSASSSSTDTGGDGDGSAPAARLAHRRRRRRRRRRLAAASEEAASSLGPPPLASFVPRDLRSADPLPAFSAAFSADGRTLFAGTACRDAGVRVFDLGRPGDAVGALPTSRRGPAALAAAPPGTGGGRPPASALSSLAPPLPPADGPTGHISSLATSGACAGSVYASLVAGGGTGGGVGLWDGGGSGEQVALLQGHGRRAVTALAFSPCGARLFSGARGDPALHCWDVRALGRGVVWTAARDAGGTAQRLGIGLTPDGSVLLAGGKGGCVRGWHAGSGQVIVGEGDWVAAGGRTPVSGVAVHPVRPLVATAAGARAGGVGSEEGGGRGGAPAACAPPTTSATGGAPPVGNAVSFWRVASTWADL